MPRVSFSTEVTHFRLADAGETRPLVLDKVRPSDYTNDPERLAHGPILRGSDR
jgi:hypothetical protein